MKNSPTFLHLLAAAILRCLALRAHATVGAATPFTTIEAEDGQLGGGAIVHTLDRSQPLKGATPELEASGHAYVELKGTGQSVTWKNTTTQSFTAINIRFSIPDAPQGGGTSEHAGSLHRWQAAPKRSA